MTEQQAPDLQSDVKLLKIAWGPSEDDNSEAAKDPAPPKSRKAQQLKAQQLKADQEFERRYRSRLYGCALNYLDNSEDAEDCVQDTLIAIGLKISTFNGDSVDEFERWIFTICRNFAKKRRVKASRVQRVMREAGQQSTQGDFEQDDPVAAFAEKEITIDLAGCVHDLPDPYRDIVKAFYALDRERYSLTEIGDLLGITKSAVHYRLNKARQMLQECMRSHGHEIDTQ